MTEEPFGPVAPIATFAAFGEAVARASALPFGFAGHVFSRGLRTATLAAEAPFGGVEESGMGRQGGALGIRDYLEAEYVKTRPS